MASKGIPATVAIERLLVDLSERIEEKKDRVEVLVKSATSVEDTINVVHPTVVVSSSTKCIADTCRRRGTEQCIHRCSRVG
jgi:hypothetical protein